MGYLEKVLGNCATGVIIILCLMSVAFYFFLAPFISPVLLHLFFVGVMLWWVRKFVVKIRKRILRYVFGLLERERSHYRQQEEGNDYPPIGFQQQITPDYNDGQDLEYEEI